MYKVVFDVCPIYLVFGPYLVCSLVCKLMVGDEYYSMGGTVPLYFSVNEENGWDPIVITSGEDTTVKNLCSRHSPTDVF